MEDTLQQKAEQARENIDINIFKGYDVRGDAQVTAESPKVYLRQEDAFLIGQAIASGYTQNNQQIRVLITSDHRPSSPALKDALAAGFASAGAKVYKADEPVPTGATSWAILAKRDQFDVAVQITGSHNPYYNNGFKITTKQNENRQPDVNGLPQALYGQELKNIYLQIQQDQVIKDQNGEIQELSGLVAEYQKSLTQHFQERLQGKNNQFQRSFRVILDAGNGLGCKACPILEELGVEVLEMYTELHGEFPHHPADPSKKEGVEMAQNKVRELNGLLEEEETPWLALVFDGDGDRCGIINELGDVLYPERILALFYIRFLLENKAGFRLLHRLSQEVGLALDVRGTNVISDIIDDFRSKDFGVKGEYIACGYPNHRAYVREQITKLEQIKQDLAPEEQKLLTQMQRQYTSAESSGHFFYATCKEFPEVVVDDGIFSCVKLLEILDTLDNYEIPEGLLKQKSEHQLKDVFAAIQWRPVSNEIRGNAPYEEDKKNQVIADVIARIEQEKAANQPSLFSQQIKDLVDVDGIRVGFVDGSFLLIRASQTSPKLTYKFEAYEQQRLVAIIEETIAFMKKYQPEGVSVQELEEESKLQRAVSR